MPIPILRTKLYIPPVRPELVTRERLVERLNEGLRRGHKLTLVSAPAGFGKTTLLSEWIGGERFAGGERQGAGSRREEAGSRKQGAGGRRQEVESDVWFAWLSLDGNDGEPTRFWAYVLAALRTVPLLRDSGVGASALAMLESPQPPPVETLLTDLINDISGVAAASHFVLVLDDFHVIANPQVNEGLTFLLDNLPPRLHLVIATRSDPLLPLSRLRGRAQLTELSASDLRFTPEEANAFLNQVMGLALAAEDVAALETRTEGWIVGLQMAAHALQGTVGSEGQTRDFISAFADSHRYILDYLTDEVLLREPEAVQAFLLRSSVLERLSGPLCETICGEDCTGTGQASGQEMLERLDADNLFIVPLDSDRQWYRYHHLFADLLRKRLHRTHPDLIPTLHQRASAWYEDAHLVEEAIAHAINGADHERAARLVEQYAVQQMGAYRRETTVAEWLAALPEELVRARPWLCVYLAWTRYWTGLRDQVEECLVCAEERLLSPEVSLPTDGARQADEQLIAGYIAAIRAHHALTNQEIERVVEMAQRAIAFLPEDDYMRCEAAVALGGAYWAQGNVVASERAFAQARTTAQKSGYSPLAVPSGCYVGAQQIKRGRLYEAEATYRQALDWAVGPGGRLLPVAGFPLIGLGNLAREWNDLETARHDLTRGIELCKQLGHADVLAEGYVMLARLQLAEGNVPGVRDSLRRADDVARDSKIDPWITSWADACRLQAWLSMEDVDAAVRWAKASGLGVDDALSFQYDLHHLNLARVLIAQGDLDQASRLLARLLEAAQEAGWVHQEIQALILQALDQQARGNDDSALGALERATGLAEPGGYVRTFVDEGALMARLLRQVPRSAYVERLLAAFEDVIEEAPAEAAPPPSPLVEPLSEREIEILRLIAEGMTNREIGETLFISLGTVKAHTSNIYGKLGVRSRTRAVARARELGIL